MLHFQDITTVLVGVVTFFVILSYVKILWQRSKLPPGPLPLPFLGNFLQLRPDRMLSSLKRMSKQYGPVYTVHIGSKPFVVVTGYQALKEVYIEHGDAFVDRGSLPLLEYVFDMKAISMTNGNIWKQLRQFCLQTLRDFGMGKKNLVEPILEELHHLMEYFRSLNEQPVDPSITLSCASSNILASILMGKRYEYHDEKWMSILQDSRTAFNILSSTWGLLFDMFPTIMRYIPGPHQNIPKLFNPFRNVVNDSIRTHQDTLDPACPRDFIDCFLIRMKQEENNHGESAFTLDYLAPGVFDMFLGGTETSGVTTLFGCQYLIKYPELQAKLHEEIDHVIGPSREPKAEDRNEMPYMNALVHEIQRFSDVVPLGLARATSRDVMLNGYHLRKGTNIHTVLTSALKDPTQFETPEVFNIKHFLDENWKFKKNNAFIPFAAGKRQCIAEGMVRLQLFLFFTILLQKFTLKSPVDPKDLDISPVDSSFTTVAPNRKIIFIPRTLEGGA
ncbi:cytochrome P450 2A6-like [Hyperolius riggenbachi]|uniref:cytochrome P450 2A6-like n=1 Tax=Hyperolius riggenbachi TaxID=752182 RepID=UPI0035A32518